MRPINLIISAFGPYAEEVKIEFDKFMDKGIYLISGNTGAGKSTIFEAIKFVLYGDDNGEIRSKYASDDAPTYVTMTFLLHGKEYKITRNPKYLRPKSRGEGSTVAKAEAELIYPDGRVVSGYANVTKDVIVLTGLNGEQFSKIVMIAQGKFRELLVADTASRSKIFRDIFKTEPYDRLQRKVKNKYLEVYKENAKTNDSIKQFVQGIKVSETYEKQNRLENIMNQEVVTDIDEVIELVKEIIVIDEDECKKNNVLLTQKDEDIQKVSKKILEDTTTLETIQTLQVELNKLEVLNSEFEFVNQEYERENGLKIVREKLLVEIEQEKRNVEKYKQYEEIFEKLEKACKVDGQLQGELAKLIDDKGKLQEKLAEAEVKIRKKLENEKQLIVVNAAIKENEDYIKKLGKIKQCHSKLVSAEKIYEQKLLVFKEKEEISEHIKIEYNHLFKVFIEAQAGIMARELENNSGMPCPVCGSTTYVKLADYKDGAPTEDEVNKYKQKMDKAINEVMDASNDAGKAKTAKEAEINNLLEVIAEVDNNWTSENYYDCLCEEMPKAEENLTVMQKKRDEIVNEISNLDKEIKDIPAMREELENIDVVAKSKEEAINSNKLEIKHLETNAEIVKEQLKSDNEAEAVASLKVKEENYNNMVKSYDKAVETYNKHIKDKTQSETIVGQLKKQLETINIQELSKEGLVQLVDELTLSLEEGTKQLEDINILREEIRANINNIYSRIQCNSGIVKDVEAQKKNLGRITKRLSELKVLSDTLNGEMEGKDKIKLETFVQISYFEQVILKANIKLFEMTEGQYEFIRDTSSEDKRTKSGLELSVYDHYNGTIRSVKTLSGGEGFMAALSLALGMADIIEESASGIAIDTMFIDEGFGSLDEAALEQAMKVLGKLSEGNKLVGIISHVSSLKDRIDRQINVEKRMSGGSSVKVVV